MARADAGGVAVPLVLEVDDDALVLERIDGPTMEEQLLRRPWRIPPLLRLLAQLHERVADAGLAHLDLNPGNVILSPAGPVVIDWTNARPSPDLALDAALTYVILATSGGVPGRALAWTFARSIDVRTGLGRAVDYRLADVHVTDAERARVRRLLPRRAARRAGRSRGG
jgi:phosphotransferase family enzyme